MDTARPKPNRRRPAMGTKAQPGSPARPAEFRRVLLAALCVALLVASGYGLVKANEKFVEIDIDGQITQLRTHKKTISEVLAEAKVTLAEADAISPAVTSPLEKRQRVVITRAVPVSIVADGNTIEIKTVKKTILQVLEEAGVSLGPNDKIKPGVDAPVEAGVRVEITRVKEEITTTRQTIAFTTIRREDQSMDIGQSKVVQTGQNGTRELKYRDIYENGKKVTSILIENKVVKQPVTQIIAYGTAGAINRGNQTIRFKKAFDMTATAYYPGPESTGRFADGYTAIGMRATFGVVAVDPKVIPLRSRLYIDGYGFAIAGDVGSAIKGNKIDLCFDTKAEALKWGRRQVKVYLLE